MKFNIEDYRKEMCKNCTDKYFLKCKESDEEIINCFEKGLET